MLVSPRKWFVMVMNLFLFLLTCLNVLNKMGYTIAYFPLFPAPNLAPERDPSCTRSSSYRSVSSFLQLYLYQLLAVAFVQGVFL